MIFRKFKERERLKDEQTQQSFDELNDCMDRLCRIIEQQNKVRYFLPKLEVILLNWDLSLIGKSDR